MDSSSRGAQPGFTVVEVMISLTIITVMVGLVSGALANYLRITAGARNTIEIVGAHEKVLRLIRDELRQSSANRLTEKYWIEGGGSTLRLKKLTSFALDADGKPQLAWSSDIAFTLDGEGFVTRSQDGATLRIAGKATELSFTEIDNGRVRIQLTNQTGVAERNTLSTLTTVIEVTPQN